MENVKKQTIYTIGHSTRPIEEFIDLLHTNKMKTLVDVRSLPGSNKFPQYNQEVLSETLKNEDIEYIYMKELGGRRKVLKNSINTSWRNKSFQGYADYMGTEEYQEGLERLMSIASKKRTAIMCAEAVWWRCHRSMISDSLKVRGWEVLHIINQNEPKEHPYTSPARIVDSQVFYHEKE